MPRGRCPGGRCPRWIVWRGRRCPSERLLALGLFMHEAHFFHLLHIGQISNYAFMIILSILSCHILWCNNETPQKLDQIRRNGLIEDYHKWKLFFHLNPLEHSGNNCDFSLKDSWFSDSEVNEPWEEIPKHHMLILQWCVNVISFKDHHSHLYRLRGNSLIICIVMKAQSCSQSR